MPPLLLALSLVAGADAKPRKDKPSEAPAARVSVPDAALPAADARSPYASPVPALQGPTATLALEGLTRDHVSFKYEVDLSILGSAEPALVESAFAQLAADPEWRVGRDGGRRIAVKRQGTPPRIAADGWWIADGHCARVALLEGPGAGSPFSTSPRVTRSKPESPTFELEGFRPDGGVCPMLATALRVDGPITLELFEAGPSGERMVSTAALLDLPNRVASLRHAGPTLAREGHDPLAMPPDEPRTIAGPELTVAAAGLGRLSFEGRVNPGAAGWTWVRVLGPDGRPWEEAAVSVGTLEQTGWSPDPTHGFWLQSTVGVPSGAGFSGTAELWFQGAQGPPTRLYSGAIEIPER